MKSTNVVLRNEKQTRMLGEKIASDLKGRPALLYLFGEMGAGKTTLCQGIIAKLLGRKELIQSPTYSYVNRYENSMVIYHFDLYRIKDPMMIFDLGLSEMLMDETALRIVEWAEQLGDSRAKADIEIYLQQKNGFRIAKIRSHRW